MLVQDWVNVKGVVGLWKRLEFWLLVAGCWLLASGFWLLVAGFWLLVAGCWFLDASAFAVLRRDKTADLQGFWLLVGN